MNIEQKQKELDSTNYWDAPIYNFYVSYFGDETIIEYEDDQEKYWRATFLLCGKVEYTTYALWKNWRDYNVKSLKKTRLGYSHKISRCFSMFKIKILLSAELI